MKRKNNLPAGCRFINVNILEAMEQIVSKYVHFYQTDFYDYDVLTIKNTVGANRIADRRFLWLPRHCGTYLFYEIDVMTRIPQRKAFNYYYEQHSNTLLFAIEVRCGNREPDNITGDLFALDYGYEYQKMQEFTFSSDGYDTDRDLYEAIQWANHRRMVVYPEGDLVSFMQDIDMKSTGVA